MNPFIMKSPTTDSGSSSGSSSAVASCICARALPVSASEAGSRTPWRIEISVISWRIGPSWISRRERFLYFERSVSRSAVNLPMWRSGR